VQVAERRDDEGRERHVDRHARLVLHVEEELSVLRHAILRKPGCVRDAEPGVAEEVDVRHDPDGIVFAVAALNGEATRGLDARSTSSSVNGIVGGVSTFGAFMAAVGFSVTHFAAVQNRKKRTEPFELLQRRERRVETRSFRGANPRA